MLALVGAGCAEIPETVSSETPDKVWCSVRKTECAVWLKDADGKTTSDSGPRNRPPVPDAGEDLVVAAAPGTCEATVTLDGRVSDPDDNVRMVAWSSEAASLGKALSVQATLPVGEHVLKLRAFDLSGAYTYDDVTVTVTGEALPEFVSPAPSVDVSRCAPGTAAVTLDVPEASDPCSGGAAVVTGRVILVNGEPADIPVVDGRATLPPGTSTVEWTATNGSGSATFRQEVHVGAEPTLFATGALKIGHEVQLTAEGGQLGSAMNVGNEPTILENRPAPLFLGSLGAQVTIVDDFWGVIVLPNGTLRLHNQSMGSSRGRFYARAIDVQPNARVEHDDVFCR
ncbi:hypothetical protein [Sorangium cellulosum]|nr:hypothetical protein [Sorangium cellulosum]